MLNQAHYCNDVIAFRNSERDDRSNLRKWMNKKFKERHTLYKTHREELRKKERVPYSATPTVKPPLSKTIHQRRVQDKENFELRLSSAQELMDDLMSSSKQFSSSGGRPGNKTAQRENHPQSIKNESFKSERESGGSKRLISSVEGLNERERKKMAEILASTEYEKGSTASNSTIINTSLDWSEVDDLL
jgi:DNA-directed RNA polymerase subunit L